MAKQLPVFVLAALLVACSSEPPGRRGEVGVFGGDGTAGVSGNAGFSGNAVPAGGAGGGVTFEDNALTVEVENIDGLAIEIITLSCAGDCAEIEAVASGGHPPYAYRWEDGSTEPRRRVCLEADAELAVSATDTAIETQELGYAAQTATTEVTARVLDCSDAGPPPGGGELCIPNPSFEVTDPSGPRQGTAPPEWQLCDLDTDIQPNDNPQEVNVTLPPNDGATYVGFTIPGPPLQESIGTALCNPLKVGEPVSFEVDLTRSSFYSDPDSFASLAVWGGTSACAMDELMVTSPEVTSADSWTTYCVTFVPTKAFSHITLQATRPPWVLGTLGAYLLMDNIRPTARCD